MDEIVTQSFLEGKHVVVFGAGYVGGAVACQALAEGAQVTALTRNPQKARCLEAEGCRVIQANLEDDSWHSEVSQPDLVVNCVSSGRRGLEGYQASYVQGAQSIGSWGRTLGTALTPLIYTGSTSVYPQDGGQVVDESMPTGADDERTQCLIETEKLVADWDGPSTTLRLAGIYGPTRHFLLDQLRERPAELPGRPEHYLNLIHLEDTLSAIWCVARAEESVLRPAYNVVDDGRATRGEIVAWLADRLNLPRPSFSGAVTPGRRAVRPNRIIANSRLKEELGWRPLYPTFREGYADLLLEA